MAATLSTLPAGNYLRLDGSGCGRPGSSRRRGSACAGQRSSWHTVPACRHPTVGQKTDNAYLSSFWAGRSDFRDVRLDGNVGVRYVTISSSSGIIFRGRRISLALLQLVPPPPGAPRNCHRSGRICNVGQLAMHRRGRPVTPCPTCGQQIFYWLQAGPEVRLSRDLIMRLPRARISRGRRPRTFEISGVWTRPTASRPRVRVTRS
jgi:hypothetical protein